jgi:outer membrane protein assembly factor BamB
VRADPTIADEQVLLAKPYTNKEWSQSGGSAAHSMYHLSLGPSPRIAWTANAGSGTEDDALLLAQPLVVDGRVFTMDVRSKVTSFSADSGKRIWQIKLDDEGEDDFFGGGIAYAEGRIFVSTGLAKVFALNAENGEVVWQRAVPGPIRGAPAYDNGRLFAVTLDNQLIALAAEDGKRLWSHVGVQETAGLIGSAAPAVSGDIVVVPYSSGELLGILAENGRVLWNETLSGINRIDPLADISHIRGLPVIDRGMVFAISHGGRMAAVDLKQGVPAWNLDLGGVEMPWVGGEFVFVLTNEAELVCLRRKDGRVRWVQALPRFENEEKQENPIRWRGPVLAGDRLILAGSHGEVLSLSPYSGEPLGYMDLPAGAAMAPIVANGTLYFLTDNATLVAMR